jgi:outer membrane protein assembly factor BamD
MRFAKFFSIIVLIAFLSGCNFSWGSPRMSRATPEGLYEHGYSRYQDGKYTEAIESFQRLKEEYPLSKFAIMAEIGIADSFFSKKEYAEAEIYYNDFMNLHPINENLPYVMYQLGMCHYKQMYSIDRDQTETVKAKKEFERLISRFPSSKFSIMADKKLRNCRKSLGEQEFYVGHFYFKMKRYKAALKRFETVVREYSNLGMDYKVSYFLHETKRLLKQEEKKKK